MFLRLTVLNDYPDDTGLYHESITPKTSLFGFSLRKKEAVLATSQNCYLHWIRDNTASYVLRP